MAKQVYIRNICTYETEYAGDVRFDEMASGVETVVFGKLDVLDDKSSSSGLVLLTNTFYHIPDNIERLKSR